MAEEHRCQAPPEGHRLCANNCGLFGIPATMNLCSTCYRDYCFKEQQRKQQSASLVSSLPSPPLLPLQPSSSASSPAAVESQPELAVPEAESTETEEVATAAAVLKTANRCTMCRKKVGLTGFRCRCGITFCGVHRYPEKHGCTFDFKKAGREEIAHANPLVVADKIQRI